MIEYGWKREGGSYKEPWTLINAKISVSTASLGLCIRNATNILFLTCRNHTAFGEQTCYKKITQLRSDISEHTSFPLYFWISHWKNYTKMKRLATYLGVADSNDLLNASDLHYSFTKNTLCSITRTQNKWTKCSS